MNTSTSLTMKKIHLFLLAIMCLILAASCSKNSPNDNNPPVSEQKWRMLTYKTANSLDSSEFTFQYDADGKMSSATQKYNQQSPIPSFNIQYAGNDITIRYRDDPTGEDTVSLFLDNNKKKTKRVMHGIYLPQPVSPFTDYRRDTSDYEYDGTGLLLKETVHHRDTINWPNGDWLIKNGLEVINYNNSNGNLASVTHLRHDTSRSVIAGVAKTKITTTEITANMSYTKQFPNKTDFTNQEVLNEFHFFTPYTIDKGYSLIPNSMNYQEVQKDQSGAIIYSSYPPTYLYEFTYDTSGLVIGKVPSFPTGPPFGKNTFSYGTP
jgi:hypothetical protein